MTAAEMVAARFWAKVEVGEPDACWRWLGRYNSFGYGVLTHAGKKGFLAHRLSLQLKLGRELRPDELARHSCDHPWCKNPAHLSPGTHADNRADCVSRNRQAKGEGNGRAKLRPTDVLEIRARVGSVTVADLARQYSVSRRAIRFAIDGRNWRHL